MIFNNKYIIQKAGEKAKHKQMYVPSKYKYYGL